MTVRPFRRVATLPLLAALVMSTSLLSPPTRADETFTASVTLEQAPSVDCTADLSFGRVLIPRNNAEFTGGTLALGGSPSLALTLRTSAVAGQVSADGAINFFGSFVIPANFSNFGQYQGTFTVTVVES